MTQSIFNSVRKLNFYNFKTKYINPNESVGDFFKKQSITDYGSIPEPSCLDYNENLNLLAIGNKKGMIKIFGSPGICYSTRLENQDEIWNIKFILDTNYFVILTAENKLILWFIVPYSNELLKVDTISNLHRLSSCPIVKHDQVDLNNNFDNSIQQNITVIEIINITSSIIMGNGEGSLIEVKLDLLKMRKQQDFNCTKTGQTGSQCWQIPTKSDIIDKHRMLSKLPIGSQSQVLLNEIIHISARPGSRKHLLIGYRSGYSIIYDLPKDSIVYLLCGDISLNGLSWCPPDPIVQDSFLVSPEINRPDYHLSNTLYSCHEDGSLILWNLSQTKDVILAIDSKPVFPHANNQKCLSISKILWKKCDKGYMIIFAGGLPRSDHMSKSTVTIMNGDCLQSSGSANTNLQHVVLDLTSQLIDFHTIDDFDTGFVKYLLVLTEEEFFIVDLTREDWPILHDQQPYLNCLHHSPITAYRFFSNVQPDWFQKLNEISCTKYSYDKNFYTNWPISGYPLKDRVVGGQPKEIWNNDLLVIGHGDGTIVFWRLGFGGCMQRISTIKSSNLFKMSDENHVNFKDYEDDIIPFRRAGLFDPCCDDNRLAIQLIHFSGNNIVIGGYGGQVVLWGFGDQDYKTHVVEVDLTTHLSNFKWKGCQPFQHVEYNANTGSPFQTMMALSIFPPSQITSLDVLDGKDSSSHILIACGTMHGLVMVAVPREKNSEATILTTHCTVPRNSVASQEAALGEGWARRRTRELKKSLRSSFRRLRRRSTKRMEHPIINRNTMMNTENRLAKVELVENEIEFDERPIEDRPKDTANDGLIKSIKIHLSFIKKKTSTTPERILNLLAGSYGGQIIWFQSDNSIENISLNLPLNLRLIKQYQYQHRAPILYFNITNSDPHQFYMNKINENVISEHESGLNKRPEQLLVITEEQVRLYAFPSFTLRHKMRATANDGFRLKNGYTLALSDENSNGHGGVKEILICATNNGGQFLLLNFLNLKRKDIVQFVDKTDLMALSFMSLATSFKLTKMGSVLPYGIYYSGQGQITLFEIVSKNRNSGPHSIDYISGKGPIS